MTNFSSPTVFEKNVGYANIDHIQICTYVCTNMYRYVLNSSWCRYLVRVIRTNTCNTEYVLTSTYFVHIYVHEYVQIRSFRSWRSLSQPTILCASRETGAIRVRGWIGISKEGFIQAWRETGTSKQKRELEGTSSAAEGGKGRPTAGQQFMAEPDFCTRKNFILPFPSAREESYRTL